MSDLIRRKRGRPRKIVADVVVNAAPVVADAVLADAVLADLGTARPARNPVAKARSPHNRPQGLKTNNSSKIAAPTAASQKGSVPMITADVTKQASEKVQAFFSNATEKAQAAFGKSSKFGEEFSSLAKDNAEALVESGKLAAKGVETLAQDAADYGKRSFEHASATFKTLATAKTPAELFQLQSEYARASFDNLITEASKFSESWLKITGDVFQPISNRYAVTVEKFRSSTSF